MVSLTSCAEPKMADPVGEREAGLTCQALAEELASALELKKEARSEDRAKASYLLVVPAYVSWYRMDKAEQAAEARAAKLHALMAEKHCLEDAPEPQPEDERASAPTP